MRQGLSTGSRNAGHTDRVTNSCRWPQICVVAIEYRARGPYPTPVHIQRFKGQGRLRALLNVRMESRRMPEDIASSLPPFRVWDRGGARPVLALHCSLAHSGAWAGLAQGLSGVKVTATDQPGHGRAQDWDGTSDLHGLSTRQAVAMAEDLGQGAPIDLFGHSFGATIALRIALERPDLVRSLMLVEPVIFAAARAAEAPVWPGFLASHQEFETLVRKGKRPEATAMFHGFWGNGEPFEAIAVKTRIYLCDRIHFIVAQGPALFGDSAGLLRYHGLESIAAPVLLVEGAESPAVIAAVHAELARRLPNVSRLAIAGAGHMVAITHADELAAAVQTHLDSC